MVGGSKAELDRAKPVLRMMAHPSKIIHCGLAGAGMAAKIINNYIATASYVALCEDVINASSGMSWNALHMNPVKGVQTTSSASRDFEGGASHSLAVHSTEMAVELMDQVNAKYLMAPVLRDLWTRAGKSPHCIGKEYRSVYRLFSKDDGCALDTVSVE
ncbi:hypothetical protein PRZ48_008316 [Zasmidium cellare]|uniref:3-hydroxyisobutyrate dehydrogenase-like NAD-binding domain-containing protein n=1 Tax=Zasmidium cellare TaxID=395010 RepID=A0ABR0EG61_ZASCE|nr:hypothetical protein PRZ48_008316 [Zasmidium cellare]